VKNPKRKSLKIIGGFDYFFFSTPDSYREWQRIEIKF